MKQPAIRRVPPEALKSKLIAFKDTESIHARYRREAARRGMSAAQWLREAVRMHLSDGKSRIRLPPDRLPPDNGSKALMVLRNAAWSKVKERLADVEDARWLIGRNQRRAWTAWQVAKMADPEEAVLEAMPGSARMRREIGAVRKELADKEGDE